MNRDISIERLYTLGDYKNIKFGNVLKDIPEEIAQDDKLVSLLYFQQMLSCEIAYRQYVDLLSKIKNANPDEVMEFLTEQRVQTWQELRTRINEHYTPPAGVVNVPQIKTDDYNDFELEGDK